MASGASSLARRDALTVRRILKVNHAGEYGAIRIYRAQIFMARIFYPELVDFLEETLSHEINHCEMFRAAMRTREARPCRVMALWGNGGYLLGGFAALFGRQGVWICTAAVEGAVHRHLDAQLDFLKDKDVALQDLILGIQAEELSHLNHAEDRITTNGVLTRLARAIISTLTDSVIWLSTWGDSTRMAGELQSHDLAK
jgi:3-demethoxyubiquinol 3-hydroxylase